MTGPSSKPAGINPPGLLRRAVTGIIYGAVVIVSLFFGSLPAGIVLGIMSGFAAAEFYALERRESLMPNEIFGVAAAAFMPVAAALWGLPGLSAVVTGLIAASLVWHTLFVKVRTADTALTLFGAVYTGFLLAYLVLIVKVFGSGQLVLSVFGNDRGRVLALAVVISVWISDMGAYFIGSLTGRHKMAPHISPKKSWEGFVAGVAGCVAVWLLVPLCPVADVTWTQAALVGFGVAIAAVIGDLAESRMKREAGVKDSGNSLPGHGGFLDRLDSLILVCLVAYWILWWSGVR